MRFVILVAFLFRFTQTIAQKDSMQLSYGLTFYSGKTVVHTQSVKNIEGARPFGIEIEVAKQHTDFATFNISNAYVRTGWTMGYFNFDSAFLGYGVTASRFIEPQYRITKHLQLGIKGSVGIAYLSNPNNAEKNPKNNNYSLHLNPYFVLGGSANLRLTKHLTAAMQTGFHHISNGNLKQPNQGINWITGSFSLQYYPVKNELPKYKRMQDRFWKNKKVTTQIGAFVVPGQGYFPRWKAQRNYLAGAFAQLTKQVGGVSGLTAGAEIYYNNFKLDDDARSISSPVVAGIQAGHVFLFGKVQFSQQVGYSIYNKVYFLPGFYHRWALLFDINKKYFIGGSLKANSDNADFFDLRVGIKL